jgi:hypothetical protein
MRADEKTTTRPTAILRNLPIHTDTLAQSGYKRR